MGDEVAHLQGMKMGEESDPIHVAIDEESKDTVLHLIM